MKKFSNLWLSLLIASCATGCVTKPNREAKSTLQPFTLRQGVEVFDAVVKKMGPHAQLWKFKRIEITQDPEEDIEWVITFEMEPDNDLAHIIAYVHKDGEIVVRYPR